MTESSTIRAIHVLDNRVDRDFVIDLTPAEGREFAHLILTGKNGSGKTTTLQEVQRELQTGELAREVGAASGDAASQSAAIERLHGQGVVGVWLEWGGPGPQPPNFRMGQTLSLGARRSVDFTAVQGPTSTLQFRGKASALEQILVNLRTQVAYAREEGDEAAAAAHEGRLRDYEHTFQLLFDEPVRLAFDRQKIRYQLDFGGRKVGLNELPDGFGSALHIWAAIHADAESWRGGWGVVLIDELEAHLHLALQEKLLPLLTGLFPNVQFIVATHSPAVIASIDGAVVYDLSTHTRVLSDELRGKRYGALMTGHFGISSDFDLKTTRELVDLRDLHAKPDRTPEEDARMRDLARRLTARSHALALEIWSELELG